MESSLQQNKAVLLAILSVLLAMVTIQSGASVAKQLFPVIGPAGTTALRVGFSAIMLWLVFRPSCHSPKGRNWRAVIVYGICLGGMNLLFYLAIARIPLGIGLKVACLRTSCTTSSSAAKGKVEPITNSIGVPSPGEGRDGGTKANAFLSLGSLIGVATFCSNTAAVLRSR
ncbi:hypothetical protein ALON55S_03423 [Alishewanella longhuensis]